MDHKIIKGNDIYLAELLSVHSQERNEAYYMICKRENGEYIGTCGIRIRSGEDMYYLGNIEYEFLNHLGDMDMRKKQVYC